jgi:hypothetical protein
MMPMIPTSMDDAYYTYFEITTTNRQGTSEERGDKRPCVRAQARARALMPCSAASLNSRSRPRIRARMPR